MVTHELKTKGREIPWHNQSPLYYLHLDDAGKHLIISLGIRSAKMKTIVDFEMKLTTEFIQTPAGPTPGGLLGPTTENLFDELDFMLETDTHGRLCAGCTEAIVNCD
jgi:hypothetical protein